MRPKEQESSDLDELRASGRAGLFTIGQDLTAALEDAADAAAADPPPYSVGVAVGLHEVAVEAEVRDLCARVVVSQRCA